MESLASAPPIKKQDPSSESSALTRLGLLDAAERLFAENGIDGTSVRDITKAAQANLSAVSYHFGSKEGLMQAVFFRRLGPLNDRRLTRLAAATQRAGNATPALDEILDALIRPTVEELYSGESAKYFLRLMGRCFQEPNPKVEAFLVDVFAETVSIFNEQFLLALPDMPRDELFWRTSFMYGTLHHALDTWSRFESCPFSNMPGMPPSIKLDGEQLIHWLVSYSAAGMRSVFRRPGTPLS
ncbi:MAG TPA: TetR family transcriptional regulator [Verrucomicrobium sp.]|nr:TetR family transcriptional regulator [Verrucomicrobium sp.]